MLAGVAIDGILIGSSGNHVVRLQSLIYFYGKREIMIGFYEAGETSLVMRGL